MDVATLQRQFETINVNRQTKKGILTIIDLKVNSEMKEVVMRIDSMEKRFDQRFEAVEQRFEVVDRRFDEMEKRFDQRFEAVDRRFDEMGERFSAQFSMLKWMIGILAAMMSAFMTAMLLKG
jgi:flagellar capping protein FliD